MSITYSSKGIVGMKTLHISELKVIKLIIGINTYSMKVLLYQYCNLLRNQNKNFLWVGTLRKMYFDLRIEEMAHSLLNSVI